MYLFILRKRERASQGGPARERKRERERERGRIPSTLCTISTEPDVRLEHTDCEIMA